MHDIAWALGLVSALVACNVAPSSSFTPSDSATDSTTGTTSNTTGPTTTSTSGTTTDSTTDATESDTDAGSTGSSSTGGSTGDGSTSSEVTASTGSTGGTSDGSTGTTGTAEVCIPLLFQALVQVTGSDDGDEWVQIVNPCPAAIDLGDYALGWGAGDYADGTFDLSGNLMPGSCVVVGGPNSDGGNGSPTIGVVLDFEPDLGNDYGIGLFDVAAASIGAATLPVDSVIYGVGGTGHLDPDGNTPAPYAGTPGNGQTVRRLNGGTSWVTGAVNLGSCTSFTP